MNIFGGYFERENCLENLFVTEFGGEASMECLQS